MFDSHNDYSRAEGNLEEENNKHSHDTIIEEESDKNHEETISNQNQKGGQIHLQNDQIRCGTSIDIQIPISQ